MSVTNEEYMNEYYKKAEVLIEALPYIQKYNRKVIVVKYGGSAMSDEELKKNVIKDVTLLKLVGFKPIVVHGGGKDISAWVKKSGKEAKFVNGLRVTDAETMEIAEMVLNRINKNMHPAYDLTAVTPMTQIDPMTFLPVVHKSNYSGNELSLSADRYCKEKAYHIHAKNKDDDLDNLEGLAAVIYIDGNSMGKKLMKCADSDYNRGVNKLRTFSKNVNRTFVEEPLKKMREYIETSDNKGFRQVIGGGDEITIICDAKIALNLVDVYFRSLIESNKDLPEDEKNYACAGIAVFHAKSPFTVAYEIAESACESAKKLAHKENGNYLDFYYCHAGITTDFETLRNREQTVTARPYSYENAKTDFEKYAPLLQKAGRSNVKALGAAVQIGLAEYLFEAERVNSYLKENGVLKTDKASAEKEMKVIYDMSEFYDLWFGKDGGFSAQTNEN